MPHLRIESAGGQTRVTFLQPRLDSDAVGPIGAQLTSLVEAADCPRLCLDLTRVEYVSGAALAKFVSLHRTVHSAGGELTLENVTPFVYEAFVVTGLTRVLDVRSWGHDPEVDARVVL